MQIARRFTTAGRDAYESVAFRTAVSEIRNPDGSVVFAADGIEVPAEWSQVACDILAQKYLRKAGVPTRLLAVEEDGVPSFLWRRKADADPRRELGGRLDVGESPQRVVDRIVHVVTPSRCSFSFSRARASATRHFSVPAGTPSIWLISSNV